MNVIFSSQLQNYLTCVLLPCVFVYFSKCITCLTSVSTSTHAPTSHVLGAGDHKKTPCGTTLFVTASDHI